MFDWENRLKELSDYDIGFEIKQGYYHISIVFDEKWEILEPDNESIYVEKRNGVYHYIAPADSVTIAEMFKTVDTTIDYNIDLQKKLLLFRKKTEELQEIFANESLEVLETIEFKYGLKKKGQPKKKRGRKPKKQEEESKNLTEEYYNALNELEKEEVTENKENEIQETKPLNEDNGYIDNDEEVVMAQDGFFEELERE
jgi:hypothetical protein